MTCRWDLCGLLHPTSLGAMSSRRVRVLNVTHVLPAPSPPLPDDDGHIKLSFMDALFISRAPVRRLFFYEGPDVPPFPSLIRALQSSLAAALAVFVPLAGKLTYRPSTDDVVVDCSADGVEFVEAEFSGGSIDGMRRLAVGDEHCTEALAQLGPELEVARLPCPLLAVQVTRPAVGGGNGRRAVVVAVAIHHAVADGLSLWRFMRAWSAACRAGSGWQAAAGLESPTFDRTAIRYHRPEEAARKILRAIAPALPAARPPSLRTPLDQRRRSFVLGAGAIQRVKRRILAQSEATGEPLATHPSTFLAVSSLVWTSIARAKSTNPAATYYYLVPVDLRRRLVPPVDERFFGNCVAPCFARAAAGDLRDDGAGLARAAVRAAVEAALDGDPLCGGVDGWLDALAAVPEKRVTVSGSSNRFMAYETDFGWGAPGRVELVSLFVRELIMLLGAEDGGVQVTVTLDHEHMEGFAANFLRVSGQRT